MCRLPLDPTVVLTNKIQHKLDAVNIDELSTHGRDVIPSIISYSRYAYIEAGKLFQTRWETLERHNHTLLGSDEKWEYFDFKVRKTMAMRYNNHYFHCFELHKKGTADA